MDFKDLMTKYPDLNKLTQWETGSSATLANNLFLAVIAQELIQLNRMLGHFAEHGLVSRTVYR